MENIRDVYEKDGFYCPITVLDDDEANTVRHQLEQVEAEYNKSMHYVVKPYLLMDWVYDLSVKSEVLTPVKQILGDDVMLWDSAFIIKEPGEFKTVGWHQDLAYFGLDTGDLVTVWIAISKVHVENGCMKFIPKSHKNGLLQHSEHHDNNSILARGQNMKNVDADTAVDIELKPGEMSLHHGWTIHNSGENKTKDRRIGICFVYIKPSAKQIYADRDYATLVSGKDEFGNFIKEQLPKSNFSKESIEYQKMIDKHRKSIWENA